MALGSLKNRRLASGLLKRISYVDIALATVIAVSFCILIPTHFTFGRFSVPEVAFALLAAVLLILRKEPPLGLPIPTALLGLCFLMVASVLWSPDSWDTLRIALAYVALVAAAWAIAARATIVVVLWGIVAGGLLILAVSLIFLVVNPSAALYYGSEGLQGVYGNRNTLGIVMTQALPAALALPVRRPAGLLLKLALGGLFFGATLLTLSKTSLLVALIVVIGGLVLVLARYGRWLVIAASGALLAATFVLLSNWAWVLSLLGKDETLNGRVAIWGAVIRIIGESPLIGQGWSNSWPVDSKQSVASAEALNGTVVFHAHNEVLNWLVTLGIAGAVLIVTVYGFAFWAGVSVWGQKVPGSSWLILGLLATLWRGLSEISETNAQVWFVLMLLVFLAVRHIVLIKGRPLPRAVLLPTEVLDRTAVEAGGNRRFE